MIVSCNATLQVIQRRSNGIGSFNHRWAAYKKGFGSIRGNFWLG